MDKKYLDDLKIELDKYAENLSSLKNSFKEKSKGEWDSIAQSLERFLEEAKTAYANLESASAEEWEPLKKIASQSFESLTKSFDESLELSANTVKNYANQCDEYYQEKIELISEYIKGNPLKSALFALGLGLLVGRIMK